MIKMSIDYKKQGKRNRANGASFELMVRKQLESKGWVVIKNPNNVNKIDTSEGQIIKFTQGKSKYNPFTKALMMNSAGFPDFICIKHHAGRGMFREVMGVECKINGYLSKEEKEKCEWLLVNNVFFRILIAKKVKEGRKIKVVFGDVSI